MSMILFPVPNEKTKPRLFDDLVSFLPLPFICKVEVEFDLTPPHELEGLS